MEGESHVAANAFNDAPIRRSGEDVIVLSSATVRPPRSIEVVVLVDVEGQGQGQHMEMEALSKKLYFKTRLYDKYEATDCCMYGDGCTFAHGRAELRLTVPPVSGFAVTGNGRVVNGGGKVCFNFRDTGTCHFGDKCAFPDAAPSGHGIRLTEDHKVLTNERRSAPPPARTYPGPRYTAPGTARAYTYPSMLPPATRDHEQTEDRRHLGDFLLEEVE